MTHYTILETIPEIDNALTYKAAQLLVALVPLQRSIVYEQIDTLLELRTALSEVDPA